jgi:hypothetical protein
MLDIKIKEFRRKLVIEGKVAIVVLIQILKNLADGGALRRIRSERVQSLGGAGNHQTQQQAEPIA